MHSLHPGLILILTGLLAFVLPQKARQIVAIAGPVVALWALWMLEPDSAMNFHFAGSITMELLHVDMLAKAFGLIFCIIAVLAGIYSFDAADRGEKAAALIYAGSSLGVVFAGDWISLICFWEVMAVASWYLVWVGRTQKAKRASYRYLVMHFFGGNMLLIGAIILCADGNFDLQLLTGETGMGYWMVLLGVAVNAAIPPLHTWVADAYPESTPAGTVYMGSFTTKVAIFALIRLFAGTEWLVAIGGLMAVFGACMALIENDLRKLLSYHIVSQLGMMVAGLATGLAAGIDGAALHAAFNILYKGVLLMAAGAVFVATGKRKISELGGLYKQMPLTAVCFLIASLSIAGMPFLNGFVSKGLIMEALHDYTLGYWLVMLAGIGTWLSITLKINYFVFFGKTDNDVVCGKVPAYMNIAMVLGAALCVITGVLPGLGYSLMPNQTVGHPFTMEHIMEYFGLFIGATVPFAMLIRKMAPHDYLSLDFDWIYRKPLAHIFSELSKDVHQIFVVCQDAANEVTKNIKLLLNDPAQLLYNATHWHRDEEEMPVGNFIWVFLIFCLIAFLSMGRII
ncbi:MAG: Na(+)/H(+) antiporter subunit D [Firmicutes bacterium]|nr:Na(+)/H(+) antiporter subunit D [Bacillota bacterium]